MLLRDLFANREPYPGPRIFCLSVEALKDRKDLFCVCLVESYTVVYKADMMELGSLWELEPRPFFQWDEVRADFDDQRAFRMAKL